MSTKRKMYKMEVYETRKIYENQKKENEWNN